MTNNIQKIKYNKREYIWEDTENDFSMFRIEEDNPVSIPNKLTKYYRLSKYSVDSLLNNYLYAAHPKELNDPFDCYSKLIDTSEITDEDVDYIEKRLPVKINRDYLLNHKNKKYFIEILYEFIFEGCGIISITDSKNENPSLWANYSDNHKGFSITYSTESFQNIALGPFKVDYIDNLEKLKYNSKTFNALVIWLTSIKSKYWSNENEWRLIGIGKDKMYIPNKHFNKEKEVTKNNRKIYLNKGSILEVRLGFYFFEYENISKNNLNELIVNLENERDKELKIKLLNHIQNNNIPLSLVYLNENRFNFISIGLDYEFSKESETFRWKMPSH